MNLDLLSEGLMVTVLGMVTVFVVLIFICIILFIMGKVVKSNENSQKQEAKPVENKNIVKTVTNNTKNTNVDDSELIAVITAAIAAQECARGNNISPDKLVVRSLRRVNTWNKEAIQEQQSSLF
ncbi:MAG: OadG family protein [Clostridia bacterium]|nr:OadG family protein [Clostridia bacterium]